MTSFIIYNAVLLLSSAILMGIFGSSCLLAQRAGATHARDTSSFFPLGFYTFYICRGVPPYSYYPQTGYPPTGEEMESWVRRDSANIAQIGANYFVDWIPDVYWHLVAPGPPIVHDLAPFEDDIFRAFALQNGFRMDYRNHNEWLETPLNDLSIQELVRRPPQGHPPRTVNDEAAWYGWKNAVKAELLRIRDVVVNEQIRQSPYQTFYAAHEVDVYPDLRDNLGDISDAGRAARYALQYVCSVWDEVYEGTRIKPFVVINSLARWPHLLEEIAGTCRNLRIVAMDDYIIDPYVNTTHEAVPGDLVHRRGQREVFDGLAGRMTAFWEAFEVDVPFDRETEGLPVERWFVGQAHKNYAADSTGWALSDADFDRDNQDVTRKHQNGSATRYPLYEELRLQASLALSRGFKGIVWYTYGSANAVRPFRDAPYGMVDSLRIPIAHDIDIGMFPEHPCAERVNPFMNTARVNAELNEIGPFFRKLELVDVFDQSTIPSNCLGLTKVEAAGKYGDDAIDISVFRRYDCDSCWYFMLVNKVLNDSVDPCQVAEPKQVNLKFSSGEGIELADVKTGKHIAGTSIGDETMFLVDVEPGQGKLYILKGVSCREFTQPEVPCCVELTCSPNPIRDAASVEYRLPADCEVRIELYDALGRRIRVFNEGMQSAGTHVMQFTTPAALASGVYLLRLVSTAGSVSIKLSLIK